MGVKRNSLEFSPKPIPIDVPFIKLVIHFASSLTSSSLSLSPLPPPSPSLSLSLNYSNWFLRVLRPSLFLFIFFSSPLKTSFSPTNSLTTIYEPIRVTVSNVDLINYYNSQFSLATTSGCFPLNTSPPPCNAVSSRNE